MAWNAIREKGKEEAIPFIRLSNLFMWLIVLNQLTSSNLRAGIKKYNMKNQDKVRHGYNETITLFFIELISKGFLHPNPPCHSFD